MSGCLQVLQKMCAVNKRRLARPIKLIPHCSHRVPDSSHPPPQAAAASSSNSPQGADMSWQHARGHHSLHRSHTLASAAGERPSSSSSSSSNRPPSRSLAAAGRRDSQQGTQQQWRQQQRHCCRSSFTAAKLLVQLPLRRRFLPLLVAWLGLCGGWYSTVGRP